MSSLSVSLDRRLAALGLTALLAAPLAAPAQNLPPGEPVNPWTSPPPAAPVDGTVEVMPAGGLVATSTPQSPWVEIEDEKVVVKRGDGTVVEEMAVEIEWDEDDDGESLLDGPSMYAKDRFNDFVDIFRLRLGVPRTGRGYGAKARVTTLAQAGYVRYDGNYFGIDRRAAGLFSEDRIEGGASIIYGSRQEMRGEWGNEYLRGDTQWSTVEDRRILRNLPHWDDGRQRYLSAGAEVATPLLAVDAGVYPEEALDFVLGFFTIDFYTDDQLFEDSRPGPRFRRPTTLPGADTEASTRRKREELDALYGDMVTEEQAADEKAKLEGFSDEARQKYLDRRNRTDADQPLKVLDAVPLEQLEEEIEVTPDVPTPAPAMPEAAEPATEEAPVADEPAMP